MNSDYEQASFRRVANVASARAWFGYKQRKFMLL